MQFHPDLTYCCHQGKYWLRQLHLEIHNILGVFRFAFLYPERIRHGGGGRGVCALMIQNLFVDVQCG